LSSGYICQFNDLEVRAVLLDEIMKVSRKTEIEIPKYLNGSIEGKCADN